MSETERNLKSISAPTRLLVYGGSEDLLRTVLGSATVGRDSAGQQVLRIHLQALPTDGQMEVPIRDVLVLAGELQEVGHA